MRDDIARTLNEAADLIERDGHAKDVAHDHAGGSCVLGAIALATGYHVTVFQVANHLPFVWSIEEREQAMDEAAREFADFIGHGSPANIPLWNDAPERTGEEVVKTLRAAAAEGLP